MKMILLKQGMFKLFSSFIKLVEYKLYVDLWLSSKKWYVIETKYAIFDGLLHSYEKITSVEIQ